ncbi:sulfite exporter TauE/SafE family protein [Photobacterium sp. DNB22_13_2]
MELSILLSMLLIFIGAFVQTTTGFGMAVVASPLLLHVSPDYVPGPIVVVGLFLALVNMYKYRLHVNWLGLRKSVFGLLPGSICGAGLLYLVDVEQLSLFLGATVLVAVGASLLPIKIEVTPNRLTAAGFLSGFLGTSSGIGGPPMALLLQHQKLHLIRANLAAFFLMNCILSLLIQIPIGYMSMHHLFLALPLIPASYAGHKLAVSVNDYISHKAVRNASLLLCIVAGLGAVLSGLTQ